SPAPSVRIPQVSPGFTLSLESVAEGPLANGSRGIDALFEATAEATEEAILNALFRAETMTGRDGHRVEALPLDRVRELLVAAGRTPA
ncbi:MAG: P1 family peptidase, partial [Thermomicrobiales bacterium]|nr:P1 family peptidase [Thermomicrobiales bacterium]